MKNDHSPLKVVSNSSPLINLAIIEQFHLLEKFFSDIWIPDAVWKECVIDGKNKPGMKTIEESKLLKRKQPSNDSLIQLLKYELDIGESETIALAIEMQADLVLLDERDARKIASIYELNTTGVTGILLRAKNERYIISVKEYLDRLKKDAGFWLDEFFYHRILELANEIDSTDSG